MYIPTKFIKASEVPQETINKFSNILKNYIFCLKKYEKDLSITQVDLSAKKDDNYYDSEYENSIPDYIKKLPPHYFRDQVLKWFFSLPIRKRQSVLSVENVFVTKILHEMYIEQKKKPSLRFMPRDFDRPAKSIEALAQRNENYRKNKNKNDINNKFIAYYYIASEDYTLNKDCNSMLEKSFFNEIIFYYPKLFSVGTALVSKTYKPFFTVSESFVTKESGKMQYFFEKLSRNKYLDVPIQINCHGSLNLPYWAYQPPGTSYCFSIDELFLSFLEQSLCVNFLLAKYGYDNIYEISLDEHILLKDQLIQFTEDENILDNICLDLNLDEKVSYIFYNPEVEKITAETKYQPPEADENKDSRFLNICFWKENATFDNVKKATKEYFSRFTNSKELVECLMFCKINNLLNEEDFLFRYIFCNLYEKYASKNADNLLDLLNDPDFSKKKKNKKKNKKKANRENIQNENETEPVNQNENEDIKKIESEKINEIKEDPKDEKKEDNIKENIKTELDSANKGDKSSKEGFSFIIRKNKNIINKNENEPKEDNKKIIKNENNNKINKKNLMGCSLYVNSQCSEGIPIEHFDPVMADTFPKLDMKEGEKLTTNFINNDLLFNSDLHDQQDLLQLKKSEKNFSDTSSTVSEDLFRNGHHKNHTKIQEGPHILIENLKPINDKKKNSNELTFDDNVHIIEQSSETDKNERESNSSENKKKKKKKEPKFFLYETEKKKKVKVVHQKPKTFLNKLNSDIIEYNKNISNILTQLRPIKEFVIKIIKSDLEKSFKELANFELELYGSFLTGLDIESSDIDLYIKPTNKSVIDIKEFMNQIANFFISINYYEQTMPIFTASIPVIKLLISYDTIINANINREGGKEILEAWKAFLQSENYINYEFDKSELIYARVDLSFPTASIQKERKNTTRKQINYINKTLTEFQEIKPILKIVKRMLKLAGLNSSYKGGIASYTLFLLCHAYCKYFRANFKTANNSQKETSPSSNSPPGIQIKKNSKKKKNIIETLNNSSQFPNPNSQLGNILLEMLKFYSTFDFDNKVVDTSKANGPFIDYADYERETDIAIPAIIDPVTFQNAGHSSFKIKNVLFFFKQIYEIFAQLKDNYENKINQSLLLENTSPTSIVGSPDIQNPFLKMSEISSPVSAHSSKSNEVASMICLSENFFDKNYIGKVLEQIIKLIY